MTDTARKLTASIEDGYLVIRLPLNPTPTRSTTGKTLIVASTHGYKQTELEVEGKPVFVGANAFIHQR